MEIGDRRDLKIICPVFGVLATRSGQASESSSDGIQMALVFENAAWQMAFVMRLN